MPLEFIRQNDISLQRGIARVVDKELRLHGVPVTVEEVEKLVDKLYPRVVNMRRNSWRTHLVELGRQAAAAGVEIAPQPLEEYPRKALFDAISSVSRLTPGTTQIHVEVLDEETQKKVMRPITVSAENCADDAVVSRISREMGNRLGRHVVDAGRRLVSRSAHNGSARMRGSGMPVHVGYARVLSGQESCSFCAMLASRGPVYSEDTVIRRRDGERYHDDCDCIPVLVVDGRPWEGEQEATDLYALWKEYTWRDGRPGPAQWADWKAAIAAGDFDPRKYSPFN